MSEQTQLPPEVTAENCREHAQQRVYEARRLLIEAVEIHRAFCTDPTCEQDAGTLAFLAHSMGINARELRAFQHHLLGYELRCECDRCKPQKLEPAKEGA